MDLHLHTPASSDYRDPRATYLQILQKAEQKGVDMIAFTDHNTVSGYAAMLKEIETLELLERLGRLAEDEAANLAEYRRLRETLLVLPGFEFTATFGFHILGIFPPGTSLRKLELLLLQLEVPEEKMLAGAPDAGATSDVIDAYEAITAAGGLAIAAHANSSNGVAMQGFNFGGQTKIAYTQHPALAALEVTDLDQTGRRTTAAFFNGSKPEYPRRMHCIQGSDAHQLDRDPATEGQNKRLGVGDRVTEVYLPDMTFQALKDLFATTEWDRVRPYRAESARPYDVVRQAREQGASIVQAFHERAVSKTSKTRPILKDVVAFANTNGGTIYVGVGPELELPVRGVDRPEEAITLLRNDIVRSIVPPVEVTFSMQESEGRKVLIAQVPRGADRPYLYTPTGQIFVRHEAESEVAVRDEIVTLVLEAQAETQAALLAAAALSVPVAESERVSAALEAAEDAAEALIAEAVQEMPAAVPVDLAHRKRRRRGRGRDRVEEAATPEAEIAPPDVRETVEVPAVPAWDTRPAWEAPEAQYTYDALGVAEEQAVPLPDLSAAGSAADEAPAAPAARGRRSRRGRAREEALAVGEQLLAAAEAAPEPEPEPVPAPPPLEIPPPPDPKRKGILYQIHLAELGEPPVGNVTQERRAGLYADKAGHLITSAVLLANPEGVFELERNQLWLPDGIAPHLPAELVARPRGKGPMTANLLNAKSGPGGTFVPLIDLAHLLPQPEPPPPPVVEPPAPEPEAAAPALEEAAPARPRRGRGKAAARESEILITPPPPTEEAPPSGNGSAAPAAARTNGSAPAGERIPPPRTGVEIVDTIVRNGVPHHAMRDLRNNQIVHNVTRYSARRLWYYAIMQHEAGPPADDQVQWTGNVGLWRRVKRAGVLRYDLVARDPGGRLRVYYGVTDEGVHGPWRALDLSAGDVDHVEHEDGDWN
jgi:hypothetical protein